MNRDLILLLPKKFKKYFILSAVLAASFKAYAVISSMDRKFDKFENIDTEALIRNHSGKSEPFLSEDV